MVTGKTETICEDGTIGAVASGRRGGTIAERHLYRVEHRTGGRTAVIARTSDVYARQDELSHRAATLLAADATGELVLVDEGIGRDAARRALWPEAPGSSAHEAANDLGGPAHPSRTVPAFLAEWEIEGAHMRSDAWGD